MEFNSITYIGFFLTVYLIYRSVQYRYQNYVLLIASYIFYAWWDVRLVFLLVLSTVANYCFGRLVSTGEIPFKERFILSGWLILSSFISTSIQWKSIPAFKELYASLSEWNDIEVFGKNWIIFLCVCSVVLFFNLLYPKVKLFSESQNENRKRKLFLLIGVSANLLILAVFKYYNFFFENMQLLVERLGFNAIRFQLDIILPIGISFYTFKGIGYLVDNYRNEVETSHDFIDFAVFMSFFPALLAGPIDRARSLLGQIAGCRQIRWHQSVRGLHLFFYGFFKKVVIADGVVKTVNSVYGSTGHPSWIDVVVATLLFTIQIYCDFSGYTDMARGTAKLFGIDLMINFNLPYFSKNPREFWNRWHISLSSWLRDYLYIPLGGNRKGRVTTNRNLIITMVLGGLWHGAAWNFVLWGLYHGLILCFYRATGIFRSAAQMHDSFVKAWLKILVFFIVTCYGWLLFRAPSWEKIQALTNILIFDFGNFDYGALKPKAAVIFGLPILLCIELVEYFSNEETFYKVLPMPLWTAIYAMMIFSVVVGISSETAQFIYFNF